MSHDPIQSSEEGSVGTMLHPRETEGEMMEKGDVVSWEREESQHIEGNERK